MSSLSYWRLALRVARREAWRNKKRSLLVVAMLALPVAGATAADTLWHSSEITPQQRAAWEMGRYDAIVTDVGTPMYQTPDLAHAGPVLDAAGKALPSSRTRPAAAADLSALLPAGSSVARPENRGGAQVQIADGAGRAWGQVQDTDLADPRLAGTVDRVAGAAPKGADEVALSSELAGALHKGVGATLTMRTTDSVGDDGLPQSTTVRVTGIFDGKLDPYNKVVYANPGVFPGRQGSGRTDFPVAVPGGVDWTLAQKLNAQGFTVKSKLLLAHPPQPAQVPYYSQYPTYRDASSNSKLIVVAIALSIVLLEVILLAGPAFAVSARRRRRDFGLLGAAGADARRLRRIVLADGVVLGAVGGVIGAVTGIAASAAALPWFGHFTQQPLGGFRLKPLELLAAAALGVGTGVTAALVPAVTTARQDVLAALTGRRGQSGVPWKLPAAGLAGIVLGSALLLVGAFRGGNAALVAAGVVLAELGLVACTPVLVAVSGKLARALPLTGRLALRDSARNRGRTAPAVAAILAAVAGASTAAMVVNSDDAQQRHYYTSQLRPGQAAAPLGDGATAVTPAVADGLLKRISAVLPTKRAAVLYGVAEGDGEVAGPAAAVSRLPQNECPSYSDLKKESTDSRCNSWPGGAIQFMTGRTSVVSGGPDLVRVLLGREDRAAEAMLAGGGVVVFDKYDLAAAGAQPTVRLGVTANCGKPPCARTDVTLPAALVDSRRYDISAIVSPGALAGSGVKFAPAAVLFDTTRMPTGEEEKQADNLLAAAGIQDSFQVERGYQSQTWAGLLALAAVAGVVMLGAAAVATGLAITDAQADLETLAAVGARPRLRRLLAGSQAAVTAGLGAVLGAAFGLLPGLGVVEARAEQLDPNDMLSLQQTQFAPPWPYLGAVIVALPALAALGAVALTRSRIELRRRRG